VFRGITLACLPGVNVGVLGVNGAGNSAPALSAPTAWWMAWSGALAALIHEHGRDSLADVA